MGMSLARIPKPSACSFKAKSNESEELDHLTSDMTPIKEILRERLKSLIDPCSHVFEMHTMIDSEHDDLIYVATCALCGRDR